MYKMCKSICTLLVLIRFSKVMYFFFICNNNLQLIFHFTPPTIFVLNINYLAKKLF